MKLLVNDRLIPTPMLCVSTSVPLYAECTQGGPADQPIPAKASMHMPNLNRVLCAQASNGP